MNDTDAQSNVTQNEQELWRIEVREFCEDALRQLQQLSSDLDASFRNVESHERKMSEPSVLDMPRSDERATQSATLDDRSDTSKNRLENLKRQLSEKLKQSVNDTDP